MKDLFIIKKEYKPANFLFLLPSPKINYYLYIFILLKRSNNFFSSLGIHSFHYFRPTKLLLFLFFFQVNSKLEIKYGEIKECLFFNTKRDNKELKIFFSNLLLQHRIWFFIILFFVIVSFIINKEVIFEENKICCENDLISLFPGEENKELRLKFITKLKQPIYHSIKLKGENLLTFLTKDVNSLGNFEMDFGCAILNNIIYVENEIYLLSMYNFMRYLYSLPILTKEELIRDRPDLGIIWRTSSYNNFYISKRPLREDTANIVYNTCIKYKRPHMLLSVLYYYLGTGSNIFSINSNLHWPLLLGEAQKEYLIHDLEKIILYREQALYIVKKLDMEYEYKDISKEWLKILLITLKSKAYILPLDPIQPSIFS
jgi:hypothetical protein